MKITEEESEVSHWSEDEDGKPRRTFVKKSEADLIDLQRALKKAAFSGKTPA